MFANDRPHRLAGETAAPSAQEQRPRVGPVTLAAHPVGEVGADRLGSLGPEGHLSLLGTLAGHHRGPLVQIHGGEIQFDRFGDPHPGCVQELEQCPITTSHGFGRIGCGQQPFDFVDRQGLGERLTEPWTVEEHGGILGGETFEDHETMQSAYRRHLPGDGGGLDAGRV